MGWGSIIFLIVLGFIALFVEVFVIPGFGVVGILGIVSFVIGIYQAYAIYGVLAGTLTLIATAFVAIALVVISLRTKTWKKIMLDSNIDSKVNEIDEDKLQVGDVGVAVSRLAPVGKARINDEMFEVQSMGEFIDVNAEIEVLRIEKSKITVGVKQDN